jgi:hypothetical protein
MEDKIKVAVYTIAKNEEKFIKRWYESSKNADYHLIADTGSSDKTIEIAKSLGINVIKINIFPFRFDDARNAALAALPCDIDFCISLDVDEVLLPGWEKSLIEMHKLNANRVLYKYVWNFIENKSGFSYFADKIHSRKGFRWKKAVHEVLVPYLIDHKPEISDIVIEHHQDKEKDRSSYLSLIELSLSEDPDNPKDTMYFARELFYLKDYKNAYYYYNKYIGLNGITDEDKSYALRYMAKCNVSETPEFLLLDAQKLSPKRREPLFDLCIYYYNKSEWEKCYYYAKKALDISERIEDIYSEPLAWNEQVLEKIYIVASKNIGKIEESYIMAKYINMI